jgi:hypothetical protein
VQVPAGVQMVCGLCHGLPAFQPSPVTETIWNRTFFQHCSTLTLSYHGGATGDLLIQQKFPKYTVYKASDKSILIDFIRHGRSFAVKKDVTFLVS